MKGFSLPMSDRTIKRHRLLTIAVFIAALSLSSLAASQEQPNASKQSPQMTPEVAGQEMFRSYCASCHGLDAKGKGPAAPALKKQPSDLTLLSRRFGGKFPRSMVSSIIEGNDLIVDHGSQAMPVWGDAFRLANHDETMVKLKVQNLTAYIESIQQK